MRIVVGYHSTRILASCLGLAFGCFLTPACADPPPLPSGVFIKAERTNTEFQLKVTWKDFDGETSYELLRTDSPNPGPMLGGNPGPEWGTVADLAADVTEFLDNNAISAKSYGICAIKGDERTCFGPSARATPKQPPAGIVSLNVFLKGTDRLGFQWIQSSDTVFSRASILQGANTLSSVENDPDQSVVFDRLSPNTAFALKVCVRNSDQTAADETCATISDRTLPLTPLAAESVSVQQGDPNPRQRKINFAYRNEEANQVVGLTVNLIKDDRVVQTYTEYPTSFGEQSYSHTFSGLAPFTSYEAWVVPYNQTGVGTSAGIGFTTPAEANVAVVPLSGKSVLLRWLAPAIGGYQVQRQTGGAWAKIGEDITNLNSSELRVVVENMSGPQTLRVAWTLAYLHSQSGAVTAAPLPTGTPELVSVHGTPTFIPATPPRIGGNRPVAGTPARMGTRQTVAFLTTVGGLSNYVLQRKTQSGWMTVASTDSTSGGSVFASDSLHTLSETTSGTFTGYRVCKTAIRFIRRSGAPLCSQSSDYASQGVRRFH